MTSQDGIPVSGPFIFHCPCSAVIVSWKPSTCSESCIGVLQQVMIGTRIPGEEDSVSICSKDVRTLWRKTYNHCRRLCFGVERDWFNERRQWTTVEGSEICSVMGSCHTHAV